MISSSCPGANERAHQEYVRAAICGREKIAAESSAIIISPKRGVPQRRTLAYMQFLVGTAGWTVPKQHLPLFSAAAEGGKVPHLQRYANRLPCVEINSSFHRPHRRTTWERWAAMTPSDFRLAVKAPKAITHTAGLVNTDNALVEFFDAVGALGKKLGPVLIQLPPKLAFNESVAQDFFIKLRRLHQGGVVLEPRHPSWFSPPVETLLRSFQIARVAADPPKGSELAGQPGGWPGLCYWRLHGTPRTYYSEYDVHWLSEFAERLRLLAGCSWTKEVWVIFDNTVLGHAIANAVWLEDALRQERIRG